MINQRYHENYSTGLGGTELSTVGECLTKRVSRVTEWTGVKRSIRKRGTEALGGGE
ncbi:hypothetical protein ACEU6E_10410 [Halorutilales archaeon Cl-col2-1]